MDTERWGRDTARKRYGGEGMKKMAEGGGVRPRGYSPEEARRMTFNHHTGEAIPTVTINSGVDLRKKEAPPTLPIAAKE